MTETAIIYEDRSNSFIITLLKNNVIMNDADMGQLIKFEIKYQGSYYNSTDYPLAFVAGTDAAGTKGQVEVKPYSLGLAASRRKGELVEFIVYDASDHVSGLVWSQFILIVKNDAALIV